MDNATSVLKLFDTVPGLSNYYIASEPFGSNKELAYAQAAERGFVPGTYTCVPRGGNWYIAQEK